MYVSVASINHQASASCLPSASQTKLFSFLVWFLREGCYHRALTYGHITNPAEQKGDPSDISSKCSLLTMALCFLDIVWNEALWNKNSDFPWWSFIQSTQLWSSRIWELDRCCSEDFEQEAGMKYPKHLTSVFYSSWSKCNLKWHLYNWWSIFLPFV